MKHLDHIRNEKFPATFIGLDLNNIPPHSTKRSDIALSTSTTYGFALSCDWDALRPRNGYRYRYIARRNGASVYLYEHRPTDEHDQPADTLLFRVGAVVQFRGTPDPMDAVEVVYRQDQRMDKPESGTCL